jgi:hypothetical protein
LVSGYLSGTQGSIDEQLRGTGGALAPTHGVLAGYSSCTHGVLERYSSSTHRALCRSAGLSHACLRAWPSLNRTDVAALGDQPEARKVPPSTTEYHRVPPRYAKCHRVPPSTPEYPLVPPSTPEYHRVPLSTTERRQVRCPAALGSPQWKCALADRCASAPRGTTCCNAATRQRRRHVATGRALLQLGFHAAARWSWWRRG